MSRIPPLVPEQAHPLVKLALLPLTLPLAILLIVANGLLAMAERLWEVLHGDF